MHKPELSEERSLQLSFPQNEKTALIAGEQQFGQKIPKKYLDGEGNLQMMVGYLLFGAKNSCSNRRVKALIKSTHAEIHHQAAPKCAMFSIALLLLDSTIEAFCTACARCIRASRRRKKLNLDINPASQKELLRPRPRYGMDFYGVHNEEILGKVGLFSRETKLKFVPDRKMKRVCQKIMKMANQTLGAMIRKLSDLDYKDLKDFQPSFEFRIDTTLSSATRSTPLEIPARTIAQARIEAQRVGRGATNPEILEVVSSVSDGSVVKHILEKAVEIGEKVISSLKWHRRMKHEGLNQKGQRHNLDHFVEGARVYHIGHRAFLM